MSVKPVQPSATKVRFEFLEETREGKIWKIEALHVTTTKNRRRYTEQELTLGARSLSYRPLNINHNDAAMLPYPENCTLETDYNATSRSVSGRMRIADEMINRMIESGRINRLSVEQLPVQGETCDAMACEQHGVTFVGLALLTSDTTPGDGDTRISPSSSDESVIERDGRVMILLEKLMEDPKKEDDYPWEDCIDDQMKKYGDMETAKKVCGAIKANAGGGESYAEAKRKWQAAFKEKARKALEADDTQTSKCIAHFIDHGKDQDQAVAICLNDPGAAKESASPMGDYKTIARRALVKVLEDMGGVDYGYDNAGGAATPDKGCPPGHHKMPDGTCMPDDDMETPDMAGEKALAKALRDGLKKLER